MSFQAELKRIRQRCFLSQQAFAKEINVAFSTVNRWESGKTKPNLTAMKSIKEFCSRNDVDYASLEELWLDLGSDGYTFRRINRWTKSLLRLSKLLKQSMPPLTLIRIS